MSGGTRLFVQALAQNALINAGVLPETSIFVGRDWPTDVALMPLALIRTPRETKEDRTHGVGRPQFWTTLWLEIEARVNDADPDQANIDLLTLLDAIEAGILDDDAFEQFAHHFAGVETNSHQDASGEGHYGAGVIRFAVVFEEDFQPAIPDVLAALNVKADLKSVFDASGTYTYDPTDPNDFPAAYTDVQPAPRDSGPDGHAEGGFTVNYPPPEPPPAC